MKLSRRQFLAGCAVSVATPLRAEEVAFSKEVGLVTATLAAHQQPRKPDGLAITELPRFVREELGLQLLDLNTMNFASLNPGDLDAFRAASADAGCRLSNLKMNQRGLDPGNRNEETRQHAIQVYRNTIDAASRLGVRWVRPLPTARKPDLTRLVASLRELSDYAGERGIGVLVENFGWMQEDPSSVVHLIDAVDRNLAASPDTGNWNSNPIRLKGLATTFPRAVTCDFKAKTFTTSGDHPAYDLKQCFDTGWNLGYRGPWCLEHGNQNRSLWIKEHLWLRDQLQTWITNSNS